jgi:hypothetical protein
VPDQAQEELVELSNGCICCTLRGDLLREVGRLAAAGAFDYCLIESTGVSEPMQARPRLFHCRACGTCCAAIPLPPMPVSACMQRLHARGVLLTEVLASQPCQETGPKMSVGSLHMTCSQWVDGA